MIEVSPNHGYVIADTMRENFSGQISSVMSCGDSNENIRLENVEILPNSSYENADTMRENCSAQISSFMSCGDLNEHEKFENIQDNLEENASSCQGKVVHTAFVLYGIKIKLSMKISLNMCRAQNKYQQKVLSDEYMYEIELTFLKIHPTTQQLYLL